MAIIGVYPISRHTHLVPCLPHNFQVAGGLQDSHGTEEVVSVIQLLQAWERKHSTLNLKAQIFCELMSWFLWFFMWAISLGRHFLVAMNFVLFLSEGCLDLVFFLCFFLSADFRRLRRLRWWSLASHTVWSKGLALQPKGMQWTGDIWYQIYAYTKRFI